MKTVQFSLDQSKAILWHFSAACFASCSGIWSALKVSPGNLNYSCWEKSGKCIFWPPPCFIVYFYFQYLSTCTIKKWLLTILLNKPFTVQSTILIGDLYQSHFLVRFLDFSSVSFRYFIPQCLSRGHSLSGAIVCTLHPSVGFTVSVCLLRPWGIDTEGAAFRVLCVICHERRLGHEGLASFGRFIQPCLRILGNRSHKIVSCFVVVVVVVVFYERFIVVLTKRSLGKVLSQTTPYIERDRERDREWEREIHTLWRIHTQWDTYT